MTTCNRTRAVGVSSGVHGRRQILANGLHAASGCAHRAAGAHEVRALERSDIVDTETELIV